MPVEVRDGAATRHRGCAPRPWKGEICAQTPRRSGRTRRAACVVALAIAFVVSELAEIAVPLTKRRMHRHVEIHHFRRGLRQRSIYRVLSVLVQPRTGALVQPKCAWRKNVRHMFVPCARAVIGASELTDGYIHRRQRENVR